MNTITVRLTDTIDDTNNVTSDELAFLQANFPGLVMQREDRDKLGNLISATCTYRGYKDSKIELPKRLGEQLIHQGQAVQAD